MTLKKCKGLSKNINITDRKLLRRKNNKLHIKREIVKSEKVSDNWFRKLLILIVNY